MKTDKFGQQILTEDDVCDFYLKNPDKIIKSFLTENPITFSETLELSNTPNVLSYNQKDCDLQNYDIELQLKWLMPEEYKSLDIALYVLNKCNTEADTYISNLRAYVKYIMDYQLHGDVYGPFNENIELGEDKYLTEADMVFEKLLLTYS